MALQQNHKPTKNHVWKRVLPASQKDGLKIFVNWHPFYHDHFLVIQARLRRLYLVIKSPLTLRFIFTGVNTMPGLEFITSAKCSF